MESLEYEMVDAVALWSSEHAQLYLSASKLSMMTTTPAMKIQIFIT